MDPEDVLKGILIPLFAACGVVIMANTLPSGVNDISLEFVIGVVLTFACCIYGMIVYRRLLKSRGS